MVSIIQMGDWVYRLSPDTVSLDHSNPESRTRTRIPNPDQSLVSYVKNWDTKLKNVFWDIFSELTRQFVD